MTLSALCVKQYTHRNIIYNINIYHVNSFDVFLLLSIHLNAFKLADFLLLFIFSHLRLIYMVSLCSTQCAHAHTRMETHDHNQFLDCHL